MRRSLLSLTFLCLAGSPLLAQEVTGARVRYEMNRATVVFDAGAFSAEEMGRFALLADRGIMDIDVLLNHAESKAATGMRVTFVVRDEVQMSRSFRRMVMLPGDRVRRQTAPYLHEATHILVPMKEDCLWLSEGFASYVQSYVAERIGGYDGYVFSWGGNRNIDRLARRTLNSDQGRLVLPYVGGAGEPKNVGEDRRGVAQPLYVLAHSLVKFMIENAGLDKVKALVQSPNIVSSAEPMTGRAIAQWKADWIAMLNAPRARYEESVRSLDRSVGRLLDGIMGGERRRDTIGVVTADHGEMLGEHDRFGHTASLDEEVTRIPLIVRARSRLPLANGLCCAGMTGGGGAPFPSTAQAPSR